MKRVRKFFKGWLPWWLRTPDLPTDLILDLERQVDDITAHYAADLEREEDPGWVLNLIDAESHHLRVRLHMLKSRGWIELAEQLDVPVPSLWDEDHEPDTKALGKLIRAVKAAQFDRAKRWVDLTVPLLSLVVAILALLGC